MTRLRTARQQQRITKSSPFGTAARKMDDTGRLAVGETASTDPLVWSSVGGRRFAQLRCLVALFVLGTGCLVPGCATVLLRTTEEDW